MSRCNKQYKGFSLVETIVASVILSATVLAVIATSTMALSTTRRNRQYERAGALIEKQLTLIDFMGIDEFIDAGTLEGDVPDIEPGYHWSIETEYQDIDSVYRVTMLVVWMDRNRPCSLVVETMLNGETVYIEIDEEGQIISGDSSSGGSGGDFGGGSSGGGGAR